MTSRPTTEVAEALRDGRPMVALETSVLAQGLPAPQNRETADVLEEAVRAAGALPAWTWVADGEVRLGAEGHDLDRLCDGSAAKVARRDLPMAVAGGRLGATTVSSVLWIASDAGIEVLATGGIGGVHPGGGDVSADLLELSRSSGTVVCSGPKSIVDPEATLERLEELGVGILGYGCDRLPFFVVREAPLPLEHRADDPREAASAVRARRDLGVRSSLLVCVPVPESLALDPGEVEAALRRCMERAEGTAGKEVTPFLLRCLAEETEGRSLEANLALLEQNARIAGSIASLVASRT